MIKKYNNGKVITDGNLSSATMINASRFSFPIENDRSVQVVEQDYVVRAENFAPQNLGTQHPTYTGAILVSEGNFSNMAGGLVRFTRTFLKYPSSEIIIPTTSNVEFPEIKDAVPYADDDGETQIGYIVLRNAFSKVVSCEQRVQFVNLLDTSSDSGISLNDIETGSRVTREGDSYVWIVAGVSGSGVSVYREDDSSITNNFSGSSRGTSWTAQSQATTFAGITIHKKFTPIVRNQFQSNPNGITYTDQYTGESVSLDAITNSVDYVSSITIPSISQYIAKSQNEEMIRIEDTKIEHFMGTIYKVTNTFTKAL
jgi:hypothetical protein